MLHPDGVEKLPPGLGAIDWSMFKTPSFDSEKREVEKWCLTVRILDGFMGLSEKKQ